MASLIETVVRQAINTFTKTPGSAAFKENLDNLVHCVNQLTYNDVRFDRSLLVSSESRINRTRLPAPVTYSEICENDDVTIGIFILRPGAKLPLHDHPLMYGILKVIFGQISIQSYTLVKKPNLETNVYPSNNVEVSGSSSSSDASSSSESSGYLYSDLPLLANKHPPTIITEADSCCVLTPTERNLHEILTVDGPAAFVDILAPPYFTDIPGIGPRQCLYFIEIGQESNLVKLKQVPSPPDYWNDFAPYSGPLVSI